MRKISLCLGLWWLSGITNLHATTPSSPLSSGNFSLQASQQPGPFISFGQNIIGRHQLQLFAMPNDLKQPGKRSLSVPLSLLYGLSDLSSLYLTIPVNIENVHESQHASGFGDTLIQGEYAFYNHSNERLSDQATFVGNVTLPTGSTHKNPPTGLGHAQYFLGGTWNRTLEEWIFFASPGMIMSTSYQHTQSGTQYLYQGGIGRCMSSKPDQYILFALFELDGQYDAKNTFLNALEPHSGGNILSATPSLWFSTQQWIVQFGISLPVLQFWRDHHSHMSYNAAINVGWTMF